MRPITLREAELVLPDEKLPPHDGVQVISIYLGGVYSSLPAMLKRRKAVEGRLDSQMAQWQREITTPCWPVFGVVNNATGERMAVYGEVPDADAFLLSDRAIGVSIDRLSALRRRIENADRRGWLYGKWHSQTQPEGEWGVMHRSSITMLLSEADFLERKANGWVKK